MEKSDRRRVVPRVCIIGGKAAPGYDIAKKIIKLCHAVAETINNDADIRDLLKLVGWKVVFYSYGRESQRWAFLIALIGKVDPFLVIVGFYPWLQCLSGRIGYSRKWPVTAHKVRISPGVFKRSSRSFFTIYTCFQLNGIDADLCCVNLYDSLFGWSKHSFSSWFSLHDPSCLAVLCFPLWFIFSMDLCQ